jgi:hypothetical protein
VQADWVRARGVEHLAVLLSTADRRDDNVCFVRGGADAAGRSGSFIGLVTRSVLGWAVRVEDGDGASGDVRTTTYEHDSYESFPALASAQVMWSWVTTGRLPDGLEVRPDR